MAQFDSESDIQALIGSAYIGQLDAIGSIGGLAQAVAQITISRMVFRDNPRLNQTLQSQTVLSSILEVIRQMKIQGASVLAQTVTATPGSFTGVGNGALVASVRRPLDGRVMENSFAESVLVTCTGDSYSGTATAGNEPFSATGTGSQSNPFAFDWPLGSNCQASLNAIDGNTDNGSGNILVNSGYTDWTSNVPDNWTLQVGTAGINIARENTIVYDNTGSSLRLIGDGSTLTAWRQQFDTSGGTSASLSPSTQYAVNVFARRDGLAPAAGVLVVELIDEDGDVILDNGGNSNQFSIDLASQLTTSFLSFGGAFRTPAIMPDEAYLRFRLTTALTSGRSCYFDKVGMGVMTQLYTSGPFLANFAGSIPYEAGDYASVVITNSRGSGGTLSTFQTLMSQLFAEMLANEILLPSSATPTISDNLIG